MKLLKKVIPVSAKEQFKEFLNYKVIRNSVIHTFEGVDVYNPSIPFELEGST